MKPKRFIDWPYVVGLLLVPVVVVAVLFVVSWVLGFTRYDPAFFTVDYLERYPSPGSVAIALEKTLKEGDEAMMAELLGTRRRPEGLSPRPELIFTFMIDSDEKYFHYLYFDASNYNRVIQYVTEEGERYVTSREDLYFYMNSGRWREVAAPLAAAWWILVITFTGGVWVYRRMALARQKMYG